MTQRGRPARPATPATGVQMNEEALADAGRAMVLATQSAVALQQQLGLEDVSRGTLVREVRQWMDNTARSMFEVGIRLAALRDQCAHGEWLPLVQDELGMNPRTAQKMIVAALKCIGSEGRREKLLQLSRSKVMELLTLDDDSLDELEKTGSIAKLALSFSAAESMSPTELRALLAEREQTIAAKDRRLQVQREKIEKLEDRLDRPFQPDEDAATAQERALLDSLRDNVLAAESALLQIGMLLPHATDGTHSDACGLAARQAAEYLAQRLADVLNEAGVEVQFEERVTPEWLRKAKAGGKPAKPGHAAKAGA